MSDTITITTTLTVECGFCRSPLEARYVRGRNAISVGMCEVCKEDYELRVMQSFFNHREACHGSGKHGKSVAGGCAE